ncbi:MAG TPA: dienelactone hydrolase [Pirellulales bacterium]|jgi:predicted dienelactone hydrolase|nr:dienelactone hydrolase [Pirellulales bacterium]
MRVLCSFVLVIAAIVFGAAPRLEAAYDPLAIDQSTPEPIDLDVVDETRSRTIPIRVYLPKEKAPAPVVLFSHGLGGSRVGSAYLGKHWAARGYVVVYVQHAGSDSQVWQEAPLSERMTALKKAASFANFQLRVRDIPAVLDQLARWNDADDHALHGRLDLAHVGMSGHSFGAVTTQAVSGQKFPVGKPITDPRIKAAVLMSPSQARIGDNNKAFGDVKIPWLLLTGTNDGSPISDTDPKERLAVYEALPTGEKYQLVLENAEHSAFSDRTLPGESKPRNPNHHRAVLAITTAFWDAYLRNDAEARQWLNSDAVRSVLETGDVWQKK